MIFKLAFVAVALFATLGHHPSSSASAKVQVAEDEGDLNPQPLPPIVEGEFGVA